MKNGKRYNPYLMFVGSFIPNWILCRKEIHSNAKLVFARLAQFAGPDGRCYPKRSTLACECGMSKRTVDRAIAQLKQFKLIEVERQGFDKPNRYFFIEHEWMSDPKYWRKDHDV